MKNSRCLILFLLINLYLHYSAIQQPNKYYKYARKKRSSENKKLVFLSKKVLEEVSTKKETTGTNVKDLINKILDC